ncbi:hypothetical protein XM52_13775 [Roseovarius indicus]|uniref:Sialate O-acetylesterase domain-containing protein n=1 Tax=Roseovarius indicus TaxID=540747 RepID=A0A0T5P8P5_9RHOB|nr:hypothetical protein XM52_13775 [Roseovarius indicus]
MAEAARDAAILGVPDVYEDTTAGLAGTSDGDYFTIPSTDPDGYLDLYLNDGGSAVLQRSYATLTGAEIKTALFAEDNTNNFDDDYREKLDSATFNATVPRFAYLDAKKVVVDEDGYVIEIVRDYYIEDADGARDRNPVDAITLPRFGFSDAEEVTLGSDGEVLRVSRTYTVETSDGQRQLGYVYTIPRAVYADAEAIEVGSDGAIVKIDRPFVSETAEGVRDRRLTVVVPALGYPDAEAVEVDADGNIVAINRGRVDWRGASYIGRNAYPEMQFDGTGDIGWYDPDDVLLVFPIWGQSKAKGINGDADALISTTATYSGSALMPSYGVHVEGRRFAGVADLVETAEYGCRETPLSALVNHYIRDVNAAVSVEPQVLGFIAAQTAQPYSNIKRGSAVGVDLLNGLRDAQRYAASIGKVAICPSLFINHGQNATDGQGGIDRYIAAMKQAQKWFAGACRNILGQADEPTFIMTQIDAGNIRDIGDANFYLDSTSRAQRLLARTPGFTLALNEGHLPLGTDGLHCTNEGYYLQGMSWARAAFREINGIGNQAMIVTDAQWRSTTILDLEVHVPDEGDVEIDASDISPAFAASIDTQSGIMVADSSGSIAKANFSVSIIDPSATGPANGTVNGRWIRITFSSAPADIVQWTTSMRGDANGLGRSHIASVNTFTPIHTLPSGFDDRDWLCADHGVLPALT